MKHLLLLLLLLFLAGCSDSTSVGTAAPGRPRLTPPAASPIVIYLSTATPAQEAEVYQPPPLPGTVRPPLNTQATVQRFENGQMIWLENPGRYYVLVNRLLYPGQDPERRVLYIINEPLTLLQDSSNRFLAPSGYYPAEKNFGLIWRGDVGESTGFRGLLGWGVAPAFDYEATLQCEEAVEDGQSRAACLLSTPDEQILLHPLGGWVPDSQGFDLEGEGVALPSFSTGRAHNTESVIN